ncbi:16S rRNA (cytidine(1402)-2'-O)-methyltransferase [Roseococcus sp. DSY-14]|uniref:16S rRNA (cytidine(1402)-2'-O)-methyltransferase n=1 Tax=Roseococcus sp. DSY-14 TaxID=3369650 RepID=UPI00387AD48B
MADDASPHPPSGGLTLVATPIGNLDDVPARALQALRAADSVLCEDTRVTAKLLARHGVAARLHALHDHNEEAEAVRLVKRMQEGARLALVSDAGTPLVSDPGFRLVRAAIAAGVPVTGVPGPNAALLALTLSGLPPHPFLFAGFLPAREAARAAEVARLRALEGAGLSATLVFYEAPHRAAEALAALRDGLGPARPAALARELTKTFEEVRRGTLDALAEGALADPPRGEVVLLVGPAPPPEAPPEAELDALLRRAMETMSRRDAAAHVAAATGLPRKQVYARALEM